MITDDHKAQGKVGDDLAGGSKRRSSEEGRTSGVTSRRSSMDSIDSQPLNRKRKVGSSLDLSGQITVPTTTTTATTATTTAAATVGMGPKQVKVPRNLSMTKLNKLEPMSTGGKPRPSPYPRNETFLRTQSMDNVPLFFANQPASTPSSAGRWQISRPTSVTAPNSRSNSPPDMLFSSTSFESNVDPMNLSSGVQSAPVSNAASPEDLTAPFQPWPLDLPGLATITQIESPRPVNPSISHFQQPFQPIITKMVPTEGPTAGGIEVTILGQGFYQGISAQFGESTAIPTECYSPTTLVCLLPPSATPGPVFVTLKDQFGRPTTENVRIDQQQLFTYINATDRALMELALQIMGFKWLGKLEDARNVAAMIIGASSSGGPPGANEMAALGGAGLENTLLRCMDVIDLDTSPHPARLTQRSSTGHTLLHLAAMAGMRRFVAALLARGVNPSTRDRAGFTALHYAAWLGRGKVVARLLSTDSWILGMRNVEGKTAMDLAVEMNRTEICGMLDGNGGLSRTSSVASLVSLGESLSRASLDEYFAGSEWDESTFSTANNSDDDDELWINGSTEPVRPTTTGRPVSRRGFFTLPRPQLPQLQLPLPDVNPALYVAAINDLLQPYLQALRLVNPDTKLPTTLDRAIDGPSHDKQFDLPPPAYSELYPAVNTQKQFSLATRLSLRGRSFLRWTGMAGDAGLSPEEISILREEDTRRSQRKDYMLYAFWVTLLKIWLT
jgi:hypothetical protein